MLFKNQLQLQLPVFFVLLFVTNIYPQNSQSVQHAFHNTLVFGFDAGTTLSQTDYQTNRMGLSIRGTAEYFFKTNSVHLIGLKLKLGSDQIKGEDTRGTIATKDGTIEIPPTFTSDIYSLGLAATYSISIADVFFPYLSGGISNLWFFPLYDQGRSAGDDAVQYDKTTIAYSFEVGFKYLVSDKLSINLSLNPYIPQSDYLDGVAASFSNDAFSTLVIGLTYSPFFDNDSDGDGITGSDDLCPDGLEDFDGFEDEDGCPDPDNDGDGILDTDDDCPNEPEDFDGFEDEDGCPDSDNDGDGILDVNDKCPDEAENFNGIDDEDGCPEGNEISGEQKLIIMGDDIFSPNSAMIKIEGKKNLEEIIRQLQESPIKKWRIEAHMDSSGNKRFSKNLSLERATAVLEYISYFGGLTKENFQVFGMGDDFPVDVNDTDEGRKRNRRIEIVSDETVNFPDTTAPQEDVFNQFIFRGDDSFESNTATLKETAKILLDEIAAYIKSQPGSRWRIEGYTDNQGSASLQKKISSDRAYAVYDYLISEGVSADQLIVSGLGSSNPIANNDTEQGRSANRRVLIIRED